MWLSENMNEIRWSQTRCGGKKQETENQILNYIFTEDIYKGFYCLEYCLLLKLLEVFSFDVSFHSPDSYVAMLGIAFMLPIYDVWSSLL